MNPIIDLHTHHERCGHATGSLRDMIQAAVELGIETIAVTDHAPLFAHPEEHPDPGIQMAKAEFPRYIAEAVALKEEFRDRISVLVGVEADYLAGTEDVYRTALDTAELDYVIGSVHAFGRYHVYRPASWSDVSALSTRTIDIYEQYYTAVQQAASSGLFDCIAHMDAIKAMGPTPDGALEELEELVEETLQVIAASGVAVEINTSGFRKCGEAFPSLSIVKRLHQLGVPLTFGSDSHRPREVGYGWKDAYRILSAVGVRRLHIFKQRRRYEVSLP